MQHEPVISKPIFSAIIVLILTLQMGCGDRGSSALPIVKSNTGLTPINMEIYDKNCQENKSTGILKIQSQYLNFNNKSFFKKKFVFKNSWGFPHFFSSAVAEALPGTLIEDGQIFYGKSLKICNSYSLFPNNSIEAATLKITYILNHVRKSYLSLNLAVPPDLLEKISILPNLKWMNKNNLQKTDNALYTRTQSGKSIIAFLPHSEETKERRQNKSYWDMPVVTAHEFGHFIFDTHSQLLSLKNKTYSCFNSHPVKYMQDKAISSSKNNDSNPILDSIHEGFSDLFAYYTLKDQFDLDFTLDFKCSGIDRDVTFSQFSNGEQKRLTSSVTEILMSPNNESQSMGKSVRQKYKDEDLTCLAPNFKDEHMVGAIFAHGAYTLLENQSDLNLQNKMDALLLWAQLIGQNQFKESYDITSNQEVSLYLQLLLESIETLQKKDISISQCETVENIFPSAEGLLQQMTEDKHSRCTQ